MRDRPRGARAPPRRATRHAPRARRGRSPRPRPRSGWPVAATASRSGSSSTSPATADAAPDDDPLGVDEVAEVRRPRADVAPGVGERAPAAGVAVDGARDHVVDARASSPRLRLSSSAIAARRRRSRGSRGCRSGRCRRSRRAIVCPISPAVPPAPSNRRPSITMPGPDAGGELEVDEVAARRVRRPRWPRRARRGSRRCSSQTGMRERARPSSLGRVRPGPAGEDRRGADHAAAGAPARGGPCPRRAPRPRRAPCASAHRLHELGGGVDARPRRRSRPPSRATPRRAAACERSASATARWRLPKSMPTAKPAEGSSAISVGGRPPPASAGGRRRRGPRPCPRPGGRPTIVETRSSATGRCGVRRRRGWPRPAHAVRSRRVHD